MELKGQIEEFIYQNESNNYSIAVFSVDETQEVITVVGYLPFISVGDTLKLTGKIVIHQEYGEQFKIDTFEKLMPETAAALEKYLASGTIKGIGPATARKIIDKFGDETLAIFKFEPLRLAEIKGISKDKAYEMGEEFNEKWEVWQIVSFLEKFGIGANNSKKVYDKLGIDAVEKIQENPYVLIDIVYGISFSNIDNIAIQIGLPLDSDYRIKSGIKYALLVASYNGNTCVLKENLIQYVKSILEVEEDKITDNIINLNVQGEIHIIEKDEQEWIFLESLYKAEKNISDRLIALRDCNNTKYLKNFDNEIKKQEKKINIELSEKQFDAIKQINENNVCIITGGPGTGKTTIIKCLIELYKEHKKKVVLCAPTGRAAKRLSEVTGLEACTIHRLLKWDLHTNTFAVDASHPLNVDLLVIDEFSMVDTLLFSHLLEASQRVTKVLIIGDDQQLPSVSPGHVLKDLLESQLVPTIQLNHIYRQSQESGIIQLAHSIRNDQYNENLFFQYHDIHFQSCVPYDVVKNVKILVSKAIQEGYDANDIQVLAPMYNGVAGIDALNDCLQELLNPQDGFKNELRVGKRIFREGDKILQLKNRIDDNVFNGDIGILEEVCYKDNFEFLTDTLIVNFDGEYVEYTSNEFYTITHAYCMSIHKSQGNEFKIVIMPILKDYYIMLRKNLIYTGLTRAKQSLFILGNHQAFGYGITNNHDEKRRTTLKQKLLSNDDISVYDFE